MKHRSVDHVDGSAIAIAIIATDNIAIGEPEWEERQVSSTKMLLNELTCWTSNYEFELSETDLSLSCTFWWSIQWVLVDVMSALYTSKTAVNLVSSICS